MKKTTLLLPMAASLMLGASFATAAYAQDQMQTQPPREPVYDQDGAPPPQPMMQNTAMPQSDMNRPAPGMNNATMYDNGNGMDPRQSSMGGMPIDQETSINGIQAACTGVGNEAENKARWSAYPVKLVVAGDHGQFYAGENVSVMQGGRQIASMTCNGPWVLMKLQPGSYRARVALPGHAAKTVSFTAPSGGQREVTVHFASTGEDMATPRNDYRATPTDYQRPQSKPMDNSTYGNGAQDQPPMNDQPAMDQSPNNSDQPMQQPQ